MHQGPSAVTRDDLQLYSTSPSSTQLRSAAYPCATSESDVAAATRNDRYQIHGFVLRVSSSAVIQPNEHGELRLSDAAPELD